MASYKDVSRIRQNFIRTARRQAKSEGINLSVDSDLLPTVTSKSTQEEIEKAYNVYSELYSDRQNALDYILSYDISGRINGNKYIPVFSEVDALIERMGELSGTYADFLSENLAYMEELYGEDNVLRAVSDVMDSSDMGELEKTLEKYMTRYGSSELTYSAQKILSGLLNSIEKRL